MIKSNLGNSRAYHHVIPNGHTYVLGSGNSVGHREKVSSRGCFEPKNYIIFKFSLYARIFIVILQGRIQESKGGGALSV